MIVQVTPIIDPRMPGMCALPYPNHSKGCPNFRKKIGCPPGLEMFDQIYDMSQPIYAIFNKFDIGSHMARMKIAHPDWSQRQLACCLYWQPTARKRLFEMCREFLQNNKGYHIEACPEARGVNLTATLATVGIELEWPPRNFAYQVALGVMAKK